MKMELPYLDNEKCSAAKLTCELKNGKTKNISIKNTVDLNEKPVI